MAKFVIKKIEFCEACKGKGMVQHHAWTEYWKENANKPVMDADQDRKWFAEHGWANDLWTGMNGIPSEEILCAECEGKGDVISEVDLLEAIPILQSALKTYGSW